MSTTVVLIRHGESQANAGFVTAHPATISLTERGWAQAAQVAARWSAPPALIITSAYLRTQQTAQPTCERFPQVPCVIWPIHEFTYLDIERSANTSAAQRQPLVAAYWQRCDPAYIDGAGAESFASLAQRAEQTLLQLQQHSGTLAVFTHGQFMQMLLWRIANPASPPTPASMRAWRDQARAAPLPNIATIRLRYAASGWRVDPAL